MKSYCIASPHKNELWYDYRLYINLKAELLKLGYEHQAGAKNRIYFLGAPQKQFYPKVGEFDDQANNIALVYCHPQKLTSLRQFSKVFVCSHGFKDYFIQKQLDDKGLKNGNEFQTRNSIDIIPPFSSLSPSFSTRPRYVCDVSFMGVPRNRPALNAILPLVDELGIKLSLFGPGWDNYEGHKGLEKYWVATKIPYEHIPLLAKGSKICLIDHHDTMNKIGSISHKYVDFVRSGGFVVSDFNKDAVENYNGITFGQGKPLKDVLLEYLDNDVKRDEHVLMQQNIMLQQSTKDAAIQLSSYFV